MVFLACAGLGDSPYLAKPTGEFFEDALAIALAMRLDPGFRRNRHHDPEDLCLRCKPVWIEAVGRPGEVIVHAVE
jgi:hypothetical protein